jgi:hypothetical protein
VSNYRNDPYTGYPSARDEAMSRTLASQVQNNNEAAALRIVQEQRAKQLAAQNAGVTYEQLANPISEGSGVPLGLPVRATGEAPEADVEAFLKSFEKQSDMVRQPSHYARFTIEPATFIAANKLPFDVGNVVKYVCRYDAKNGREDLKKAARYIEMIIERLDREDRIKAGESAPTVWSKML